MSCYLSSVLTLSNKNVPHDVLIKVTQKENMVISRDRLLVSSLSNTGEYISLLQHWCLEWSVGPRKKCQLQPPRSQMSCVILRSSSVTRSVQLMCLPQLPHSDPLKFKCSSCLMKNTHSLNMLQPLGFGNRSLSSTI